MPRLLTWEYSTQTGYLLSDIDATPGERVLVAWIMPSLQAAIKMPRWMDIALSALSGVWD